MNPERVLIVRLGALGDIIHALPLAAALRESFPSARIDWLVSERHTAILSLVGGLQPGARPVIDQQIVLEKSGWMGTIRRLRAAHYDIAFDAQGLIKSAILARCSGADSVAGFSDPRESPARIFYTSAVDTSFSTHVIDRNLSLLSVLGMHNVPKRFPMLGVERLRPSAVGQGFSLASPAGPPSSTDGRTKYALINPGAGWPNKRWPADRFGEVAKQLRDRHHLRTLILWGPGEQSLAKEVVASSEGAAELAPPTDMAAMIELTRQASLVICGDTGPLHIAAAVGTPVVGIYGPTNPARNGPFDAADRAVSRFDQCICHHERRCRRSVPCINDISVAEVMGAIGQRLSKQ